MNHVRFMTSNAPVCWRPRTLGYDLVVVGYEKGENCKECLALIHAHNYWSHQYDMMVALPERIELKKDKFQADGFVLRLAVFIIMAMFVGSLATMAILSIMHLI